MAWYGSLMRLFRKKQKTDEDKKAISDIKSSRQRDTLKPIGRAKAEQDLEKEFQRLRGWNTVSPGDKEALLKRFIKK